MDECIIASMNHAIEVKPICFFFFELKLLLIITLLFQIGYVNNTKCVVISAMMQFVLRIINVIEPIGIIRLPELKNMLNITISECFLFGNFNFVYLFILYFNWHRLTVFFLFLVQVIQILCHLFKHFPISLFCLQANRLILVLKLN